MDDVDAVNAQIARNMLDSGDWVSARINGVLYLEKSPLGFWLMAASYKVFGVHDWAARLPTSLGAIALMWVTAALGSRGFGRRAGLYAGLAVGTCVGLFLFTRIVIPDVLLTLAVTCALYCFVRAMEEDPPGGAAPPGRSRPPGRLSVPGIPESSASPRPGVSLSPSPAVSPSRRPALSPPPRWAYGYWAAIGIGMLLKGLLAAVLPVATVVLYLLLRRQLFLGQTWRRLRPFSGLLLVLAIYAPWVVLATLRNPPYLDFTLHSDPGVYRGFFWFYFINEHVLRFLNRRFPRDYNTVPRLAFWLLQLVWIFPWSVFLPAAFKGWRPLGDDRASRLRLLAVLWILFLLTFLSFSTTQEYYSMPCYPAFALLAGVAVAEGPKRWVSAGYGVLAALGVAGAAAAGLILYWVRGVNAVGDISRALTQNPEAYTFSLGHMGDLTLQSFAYLREPLLLAALALGAGSLAAWLTRRGPAAPLCLAAMMTLLIHAANGAMKVFDPYLSSRPLAAAIERAPSGQLIMEGHYYPASSVVFYTNKPALLLNGKAENLIYGAAAPGAPPVFLEDADLVRLWKSDRRMYLVAPETSRPRLESLLGVTRALAGSGGKTVLTNR